MTGSPSMTPANVRTNLTSGVWFSGARSNGPMSTPTHNAAATEVASAAWPASESAGTERSVATGVTRSSGETIRLAFHPGNTFCDTASGDVCSTSDDGMIMLRWTLVTGPRCFVRRARSRVPATNTGGCS